MNDCYRLDVISKLSEITPSEWNSLLDQNSSPFLKHEFLNTLELTGCVGKDTGWQVSHLCLRENERLIGAIPLYLKYHSYGEYVFDWSWAQAFEQAGGHYYPKLLSAIPFTPAQGTRLLCAADKDKAEIHKLLIEGLKSLVVQNNLSSAHVLFAHQEEMEAFKNHHFLVRDAVQFHWHNQNFANFEDFLNSLVFKRRKNIRRERQRIKNMGITFRHLPGELASDSDWDFFYQCYQTTYLAHRSTPYLNSTFFTEFAKRCPNNLHLIIAEHEGQSIAASLIVVDEANSKAYGRYWGAIKHIPLLHFETAYYQVIDYCIRSKIKILEGGAQGEHKMARGFLPTTLQSAHFIADPSFNLAVKNFLKRESTGISAYVDELNEHRPTKSLPIS